MTVTGNSFAAPHIAGLAARIRAAHPGITPFETKTLLAATADNATSRGTDADGRDGRPRRAGRLQ